MIRVETPNGPRYHSEFFNHEEPIELQMSRHRFVYKTDPVGKGPWFDRVRAEWALLNQSNFQPQQEK